MIDKGECGSLRKILTIVYSGFGQREHCIANSQLTTQVLQSSETSLGLRSMLSVIYQALNRTNQTAI
jgi:hypothetical protein